ncbi:MAG: GNAT family N-acetyltransferase [Mycobacteriales bacterium]
MDVAAVLAAHDALVRRSLVVPAGFVAEDLGRVVRVTAPPGSDSSFVEWSDLDAATADAEIAAQVAYFSERRQAFEWKTYGRDRPADLGARLAAAGLVADDPEAFVVGEPADVLAATAGHDAVDGVVIRPADRADLPGMAALSAAVWGRDATAMLTELFDERDQDPPRLHILVALAAGEVVSDGWVRLPADAPFASLWGGSTMPARRGRGIYRALVRQRALLAAESGHRYLQVDCTPDSRPILERLGLRQLDVTTPYRFTPPHVT